MIDDEERFDCPECNGHIKGKNFERHLRRVHKMKPNDIDAVIAEIEEEQKKKKKKSAGGAGGKRRAGAIFLIIILILSFLTSFFVFTGEEDEVVPEENGGTVPSDPNRVEFTTTDGFKLVGSYYPAEEGVINASVNSRPVLILAHGMNEKRSVWNNYGLVDDALSWGFNVLTYDIRGHGESIYKNDKKLVYENFQQDDFLNLHEDIIAAVNFVKNNYLTSGRFAVAGASVSANAVLKAAVHNTDIRAICLMSPSLNYQEIYTYDLMCSFGGGVRPFFIAAGQFDNQGVDVPGQSQQLYDRALECGAAPENALLRIYSGSQDHGTNLLKISDFNSDLEEWLKAKMILN